MSRPTLSGAGLLASATDIVNTEPPEFRPRTASPERRSLPAPRVLEAIPLRSSPPEPETAELLPTVLVVAEAAAVRNAVARELARDFELLNAVTFDSAVRKLSARPSLAAIIVDLELGDGRGAPWFLARLVDHAYEGPRILLSSALGREDASSMRRGSVSHFTLSRPWSPGELRVSLETALGYYGLSFRLQEA